MLMRTLLALLGCLSIGRAAVLLDTLVDPTVGDRLIADHAQYQSFSTTAALFSLTDVQVRICCGVNTGPGSVSVDLYGSVANSPGAIVFHIGDISDSSLPLTGSAVIDLPTSSFNLSASTRYWVGLTTSSSSAINWTLGLTQAGDTGVSSEFIDDSGSITSDSFINFEMRVTVGAPPPASAPEPAGLLLGGLGLAFLRFAPRPRRRF